MNFQDLREQLKNLQLTDSDRYEILLDITQRQAKRIEHLNDILDQDHRQEVIKSMYEENKRYREALESIQDIQEWQRIEADFEVLEIVKSVLGRSK